MIASPAVRCAETIELAAQAAGRPVAAIWDRRIYLASSATLLDLLRELDGDPPSVLMVGHNPGLEDLIFDLVPDDGTSPLRDVVESKFPTAAFAVLELDIDALGGPRRNCARLVHLIRPRDLDPALGPEGSRSSASCSAVDQRMRASATSRARSATKLVSSPIAASRSDGEFGASGCSLPRLPAPAARRSGYSLRGGPAGRSWSTSATSRAGNSAARRCV